MEKIYKRLSPPDRIKICAVNSNAVPGMYPVLGAKPHKMFRDYFSKKNAKKIKDYCDANIQIILPKHILVTNNGFTFYLGPRYTKFSERNLSRYKLQQVEIENSFVITRMKEVNTNNSTLNRASSNHSNLNVNSQTENVIYAESSQPVDRCINQSSEDMSEHVAETPNNPERDDDLDSQSSKTSTNTEPEYSMKHRNLFRIPEKLNNEKIMSLLHCTKQQFLDFTNTLRPHMKVNEDFLSIYSRVFLFRFKVSTTLIISGCFFTCNQICMSIS